MHHYGKDADDLPFGTFAFALRKFSGDQVIGVAPRRVIEVLD
jgi:hypothetical protein